MRYLPHLTRQTSFENSFIPRFNIYLGCGLKCRGKGTNGPSIFSEPSWERGLHGSLIQRLCSCAQNPGNTIAKLNVRCFSYILKITNSTYASLLIINELGVQRDWSGQIMRHASYLLLYLLGSSAHGQQVEVTKVCL